MISPFSIPRTRNFANWRFLSAQQINDTKQPPFFQNVITHKNDEEKKRLFAIIKRKMKSSHVLCTIPLSGHNQLLHHLHHCNSVKHEKWMDGRQRYVFICHMVAPQCLQQTGGGAGFGPSVQKHHIWKMQWEIFPCLQDELALQLKGQRSRSLHPHGRHAYECRLVVRKLLWGTRPLSSRVGWFHFTGSCFASKWYLKNASKEFHTNSWTSQQQRPLALHSAKVSICGQLLLKFGPNPNSKTTRQQSLSQF